MKIDICALSDVGKQREHNEDSFGMIPELNVCIVADGMGGHAAGEVASAIAVETIKNVLLQNHDIIEQYDQKNSNIAKMDILQLLEQAVHQACMVVYEEAQKDDTKRGMGTTVDVLLLTEERGFIAHVGDSRVYLFRQGNVHQLTEDHSLINELIKRGKFTEEELEDSPYAQFKNALTRAVGVYESVEVDTFDFPVLGNDEFLLCSDGLSAYLTSINMRDTFELKTLEEQSQKFIQIANDGGGHDNITAVLAKMPESKDTDREVSRAAELSLSLEILHHITIFKYLSYSELVRIHNITELRTYQKDEIIVKEGEIGTEFFVILKGEIRLEAGGTVIAYLKNRDNFGEMSLVDKSPRNASAYAKTTTKVLVIKQSDFYSIIKREHTLAAKLLWSFVQVLTNRLRDTTKKLSDVISAEVIDDVQILENDEEENNNDKNI